VSRRVGGWTLGPELGRGGNAVVYEAVADDGTRAALKLPDLRVAAELGREARVHAGLRHPGIVGYLGHGTDDGQPWVAMELIRGGSLARPLAERRLLAGGTFDLDEPQTVTDGCSELLAVVLALCPTLAWLHGEGLVHLDLKPANILLRAPGDPVLADLGLLRPVHVREHVEDAVRGSVGYVSPEQSRGAPVDARADLFSLGAILFEVLTGAPPTDPANPRDAMRKLRLPPEPPSSRVDGVDPALDDLVLRLLAREPRDRPASAMEVARVLSAVLGRPTPASDARPALLRPPLVGRELDLLDVADACQSALKPGAGGLVVVHGASGVGATRLVSEVAAALRAQSVAVATARGRGREASFRTIRALAERVSRLCRVEDPLATWREDPSPTADLAGVAESLAAKWSSAATARPVLLVIDDLELVDPPSIEILGHVVGTLLVRPAPVCVLATVGSVETDPLRRLLGLARQLTLERLPDAAIASLAAGMLGVDHLPPEVARPLESAAEGSPLVAREWVATALASRSLLPTPGGWALVPGRALPSDLPSLVDARLDGLDTDEVELIATAGLLDRALDEETLQRFGTADSIRAGLRARLLERDSEGLRLVHPLVGQAAYGRLPSTRRSERNAALARELATAAPPELVARWVEAAGRPEDAAAVWRTIAAAERRRHPPTALDALLCAARLSPTDTSWADVGDLASDLGDLVAMRSAIGHLSASPDAAARARGSLVASVLAKLEGRWADAQRLADTAAALWVDEHTRATVRVAQFTARRLGGVPADELRALAEGHADLTAALAFHCQEWLVAAEQFERSAERLLADGDIIGGMKALGNAAASLYRGGNTAAAHPHTCQALTLARRAGIRETEAHQWLTLALGYELDGAAEPALECAAAALSIAIATEHVRLIRRCFELVTEVANGPLAARAADVAARIDPKADLRIWVYARLGRCDDARRLARDPSLHPTTDAQRAAAGEDHLEALTGAGYGPLDLALALDTWVHLTGSGHARAVEAWRQCDVPSRTLAIARLGCPARSTLPPIPEHLRQHDGMTLEQLVDIAARRLEPRGISSSPPRESSGGSRSPWTGSAPRG
jgi:hypothetical protein